LIDIFFPSPTTFLKPLTLVLWNPEFSKVWEKKLPTLKLKP
jgi:hypothetical protein